jgi:hypothetical protein
MEAKELEMRIEKCSFILKTLLERWDSLEGADNTVTYKMVKEALEMLDGRFHEMATINVDLDDQTFMQIALMAHERDITFNQMVEMTLRTNAEEVIEKYKETSQVEDDDEDANISEE